MGAVQRKCSEDVAQ